ncbi:3'-5' exonuclease [Paenibacillus ginsengarvi]|uniref:Exonuclease n=1 Tax=Paenibacillus ginsengarvi TaxID=400777 RepID=A0A3B0BP96_9BACL|nr:3'-5' exonuclease [Paenibacillus ginsengarvi]RKN74129.1 exonuclease [Paenibacillus ginsengarvi]
MQYIIYDLEFTVTRSNRQSARIIEIGAVKASEDEDGVRITDRFQTCVRPGGKSGLSKETTEFTGIRPEDISGAPDFRDAAEQLVSWIGEDEYYLCSWGPDDKYQLLRHCRDSGFRTDWIRNHNDLQQQFSRQNATETFRQIGLKHALELTELSFEGSQHRALDDALNTAALFIHNFRQFTLQQNTAEDDAAYRTEVVYSTGDESYSPFQKLAMLMNRDSGDA